MDRGVDEQAKPRMSRQAWHALARGMEQQGIRLRLIDNVQPVAELRVTDVQHVRALRQSEYVSYVEPASFPSEGLWHDINFGCGNPDFQGHPGSHTPEGDLIPFTLDRHQIPAAWQISTGSGITIGFIDTGASAYQSQLGHEFNDGQSSGRSISRDYTYAAPSPEPWHDTCGHGTRIAGLAVAPRDGRQTVGVAYGADAYTVRADGGTDFGIARSDEVRRAVDRAAENSDIVNIAMGSWYYHTNVADRIHYYYDNEDYQTLFIGAAGTFWGIKMGLVEWNGIGGGSDGTLFPATMDQVVAVTGLDPDGPASRPEPCRQCFNGDEVEFAAFTNGPTPGLRDGDLPSLGGSSGSTSIVSGIAALVWSRYPNWTREQVLDRLRQSAHYSSDPDDNIGYGPINAYRAVGGMLEPTIGGPSQVAYSGTYQFNLNVRGGQGPYAYRWDTGETSSTLSLYIRQRQSQSYTIELSGSVTDLSTGITRYASKDVFVRAEDGGSGSCGGDIACR